MSKITFESDITAGSYPVPPAGNITLDSDTPAGTYTLDGFVPFAVQFTFSYADGYAVTIQDTSTGTLPTDEMLLAWSNGKPTECPLGGEVTHVYPNGSQWMVTQTITRADGSVVSYKHPVRPVLTTAPSPPVSPPPPPPPVSPPPVQTPPPSTGGPPPSTGAQANATHAVVASVLDATGKTWTATAKVGDDATVDGVYLLLVDAKGEPHPGLRLRAYADCVDVGAVNGRDGFDYAGTLTITYDDAVVFGPVAVQFPRGCFNKTIRYGTQAAWHPVDRTLFPNWADPGSYTLPLADLSTYDLTYNGMGVASMKGMGSTGSRPDIAYVPQWAVPMCVQPSDAAYAVVRASADNSGAWPIYWIDDATGLPLDITTYPNASMLSYGAATYPGNPIAAYTTPSKITGSPLVWDEAHETGYNFVAAAASGTARDRFHAAAWANAMLIAFNPVYRQQTGIWEHYQERGSAWALRSLFLGSQLSCMPDYFAAQLEIMRGLAPSASPLGFQATYMRSGANDVKGGSPTGTAFWQENYTRIIVNTIAAKVPAWQSFALYLDKCVVIALGDARYPLSTLYVHTIKDATGAFLPNWTTILQATLTGPQGNGTTGAWSTADITAATDPAVTPQAIDALIRKNTPGYATSKLGDFVQYATAPDAYPALMRAACAGAVDRSVPGADAAWAVCEAVPTKPDFSKAWGFNIVPRA